MARHRHSPHCPVTRGDPAHPLGAPFDGMTAYTEDTQDGMLDLLTAGELRVAPATAFSPSPEAAAALNAGMAPSATRGSSARRRSAITPS